MDYKTIQFPDWDESHVRFWLKDIGLKPEHIQKIEKEKVTGPALLTIEKSYTISLHDTGLQGGQIQLLLRKRDELLQQEKSGKNTNKSCLDEKGRQEAKPKPVSSDDATKLKETSSASDDPATPVCFTSSSYRKFDHHDAHFSYRKNAILPPETGVDNLITPCHEYKSLENACKLESKILKVKFASEVIRFACACMNMRTNGTIHFGVMDKTNTSYKHGEIIGIPIEDKEVFQDALDCINSGFQEKYADARQCIRPAKFIPVIEKDNQTQNWIVEVDVVPEVSVVRSEVYSARIPKFNDSTKKIEYEQKAYYHRVGPNTPRMSEDDLVKLVKSLKDIDQRREKEENNQNQTQVHSKEDLGRKLSVLLTCGMKYMDDTMRYIIVCNRFDKKNLQNITFLGNMNIFCVFDFDPDSKTSGFCHKYQENHTVNLHFLHDYNHRENTADFVKKLQLYDRTSWIFCNGRNDYNGSEEGEEKCEEKTWIKNKKKLLKRAVSLICNEILLQRDSFVVIFILMSEVEQPLVETFHEFYAEMSGNEDIVIISESRENYEKWSSLAQVSCSLDVLEQNSIVGMPMSHVDATIQNIQLTSVQPKRCLPVSNKGVCFLNRVDEEKMFSLEIVSVDQCDEINVNIMEQEQINKIEQYFYQGGKIDWKNLWLADNKQCGEVIKRDAYEEINKMLEDLVLSNSSKRSVENINVYHKSGSGGSTVARQILWKWRKKERCAVVKQSYQPATVCEHAVMLRNYQEVDKNSCLPVLLLLEDCNTEYQDDLRRELSNAVTDLQISSSTCCFIILCSKQSDNPEKMCKSLSLRAVAVTYKLSSEEKKLFSKKAENLKSRFKPEIILTFLLMSKEFQQSYITKCVKKLLKRIDHSLTNLIICVALLNSYVRNSYLSTSLFEEFLDLENEKSVSNQAMFLFIWFESSETHISSVRIIHHLVAEEVLKQLSSHQSQGDIAMDLLRNVQFNHRFGRDELQKFVRDLFIKCRRSKGGSNDSWFSPLIEQVWKTESLEKAIDLLKVAYECFKEDAFIAQQLVQLYHENKRFEEALAWAEGAKSRLPQHTYILDTVGQVYKKWFCHKHDAILKKKHVKPEDITEIIDMAINGINAFKCSENCPQPRIASLNNTYFGKVEIGLRLLELLSSVDIFATKKGKSKLMDYLLTDSLPDEVQMPWQKFHDFLKGLEASIRTALECIFEDLARYQTHSPEEEEELNGQPDLVNNPNTLLQKKCAKYAEFFCDNIQKPETVSPLMKQMKIFQLGGSNVTTILFLLSNNKRRKAAEKLENIISLFPAVLKDLNKIELVNFIFYQIALSCASPDSRNLLSIQELQDLSKQFCSIRETNYQLPVYAYFLFSLLFWPEDLTDSKHSTTESDIVTNAIAALHSYTALRKGRILTHFFLGKTRGLNKIVHKTTIEKFIRGSFDEKCLKWQDGQVWRNPDVVKHLKRVAGYTEYGDLFMRVSNSNIRVIPVNAFLPSSNENVTFYLGFSLHGVVAFDVKVESKVS